MSRSFTFIDDVVNILIKLTQKPAEPDQFFDTKNLIHHLVGVLIEF